MNHLREYLDAKGPGSAVELARQIGASSVLISQWASGLRRVPAERCPPIEAATGIRCEDLRPDVNWSVLRGTAHEA